MDNSDNIEIPEDMLSFWRACLMVHSMDIIPTEVSEEIMRAYKYDKDFIRKMHAWCKRLPLGVINDCFKEQRFDMFCNFVIKSGLIDTAKIGIKRLKAVISNLNDANALMSSVTGLSRRISELEEEFVTMSNQQSSMRLSESTPSVKKYAPPRAV